MNKINILRMNLNRRITRNFKMMIMEMKMRNMKKNRWMNMMIKTMMKNLKMMIMKLHKVNQNRKAIKKTNKPIKVIQDLRLNNKRFMVEGPNNLWK